MKIKLLMKFYFSAGSLNGALDNIITNLALAAGRDVYAGCEKYFGKISRVVEDKRTLQELWARLDGILGKMTEKDRAALRGYAAARGCVKGEVKKEIHRAAVKFARRAAGLLAGGGELYSVLCAYRCLIADY